MALGIEKALENVDGGFIEKYRLMKERLFNYEYEHWAVGFPEGNNHGRGHIARVLEYLNHLVGPKPLDHLDVYELFLAMMSILYHDIGLLRKRQGHAELSKQLLEEDANDRYIINQIDKEIIAAAVVSHSSSKDIMAECSRFSSEEIIGQHRARPVVIAGLVRLADELDEDYRRADPVLQRRLLIPPESDFFWLFCQRVRGIRPILVRKQINFNIKFEPTDLNAFGALPGGKLRRFIAFAAEKLAKINHERTVVNRYLPPELQYSGLHVDVKPLPGHSEWNSPRTFVFNDSTTADMFLGSYPELHLEPVSEEIRRIQSLMKIESELINAEVALDRLEGVLSDLPRQFRHKIFYEKACVHSIRATKLPFKGTEQAHQLDRAVYNLHEWFRLGEQSGFTETGSIASAAVHHMVKDEDVALVIALRKADLQKKIPISNWPSEESKGSGGGSSGCVPIGSIIKTPTGGRNVENLQPGDEVLSMRLTEGIMPVKNNIVSIRTTEASSLIRLNGYWEVTPTQPILTKGGWMAAASVKIGHEVMDEHGVFVKVANLLEVSACVDVFDLVIDGPEHNYIANGLLCHNKTEEPPPALM
jgi:hypothetical protein